MNMIDKLTKWKEQRRQKRIGRLLASFLSGSEELSLMEWLEAYGLAQDMFNQFSAPPPDTFHRGMALASPPLAVFVGGGDAGSVC